MGVYQEYIDDDTRVCNRWDRSSVNLLKKDPSVLTLSIPHPWLSGRCFTYK